VVEISIADFLRLVAGVESGPTLFTQGRLKVNGDPGLALALPRLFRVPRASGRT
jgi:predicted lipid carrier protein YhbT